ncbi:hypothetical protein EPUS_06195 [Endocarpon pusillum Z07020]|uniref:Uncharacterized protein n=1 Tax=Endocarpon pusillum (strain Z07020 / HMAS-L-300199) TaxID=1263415 RepID=U1HWM6_ENDPU|nr:uncharacterized protein EPUS_06195 [Endocarpon pusillum Z07020]ERF75155.1 hypothetical protein EPUS_06195 [Endocarpon pusillum Z07020]
MTATIAPITNGDTYFDPHQDILAALSTSPHNFLQPTSALHAAAIIAAKRFLDPLASSVSEAQELRKRGNRKKRKRSDYEANSVGKVLQLREVYTDGFGIGQIWEQAKRILDAARDEVQRDLKNIQTSQDTTDGVIGKPQQGNGGTEMVPFDEGALDTVSDEPQDDLDVATVGDVDDDHGLYDGEEIQQEAIHTEDDEDMVDDDDIGDMQDSAEENSETEETPQVYVPDPNGLNDGFFSIDDFNKHSQFLEQQDAMGEEDNPSDEDEIDWDADPLAAPLHSTSGKKELKADNATEGEDGEGPTFGDADLDGISEEEHGEEDNLDLADGMPGLENTNDIKYADFFEPPAQKPSKSKRMRALPKTQPPPRPAADGETPEVIANDIQRAISDVRRDLLDSEDEASSTDQDDDDEQPIKPSTKNLSTHEKQRAKILSEIRRLEAAAISKRDWTLSGEARAADRPLNSLIEEDLEFERAGKPVPVITAEVSEEIEALIKQRIVAREFDEVVRRRPEALGASGSARRGRVEVDDTRPSQGLADVYEAEHLKATDPGYVDKRSATLKKQHAEIARLWKDVSAKLDAEHLKATDPGYVDKRSATLKKQHAEIARLWKDVSAKLDVLSNLHFKPKRAEISVQVVGDKPTISMEDARPGAADDGGVESRLAPQEIYTPGEEGKARGEVMGKSGMARSKEEMTKEEKLRRRRREKERAKKKKKGSEAVKSQQEPKRRGRNAEKAQEKKTILDELRKGGVKVIGKKGDVEEIDGKKRKGHSEVESRSTEYKL